MAESHPEMLKDTDALGLEATVYKQKRKSTPQPFLVLDRTPKIWSFS